METHVLLSCDNGPDREQIGPISLIAYTQPIGVTSHITPLPAGEGKGEGPLSYGLEKTIVYLIPMVRMDT